MEIGDSNTFREYVTVHSATGDGEATVIGSRNHILAYCHLAHNVQLGSGIIMSNVATLAGHVVVEDSAVIGGLAAVHQFCRVGAHAFIGGYSVITKDALPYVRTVGSRPARVFGLNLIGLKRRGFTDDTLKKLRAAYRYLTQSKLNTTQAVARIAADQSLRCPEVDKLVDFIRTAQRGVILRRSSKKAEDSEE